jgi:hypothetical protein
LLPRMACIFFSLSFSPFFPIWSVIGMGYIFFYSRDRSFMSLICEILKNGKF